jgi:hypothetical protein
MAPNIAAKATIDAKVKRRKASPPVCSARPRKLTTKRAEQTGERLGFLLDFLGDYLHGQTAWQSGKNE